MWRKRNHAVVLPAAWWEFCFSELQEELPVRFLPPTRHNRARNEAELRLRTPDENVVDGKVHERNGLLRPELESATCLTIGRLSSGDRGKNVDCAGWMVD